MKNSVLVHSSTGPHRIRPRPLNIDEKLRIICGDPQDCVEFAKVLALPAPCIHSGPKLASQASSSLLAQGISVPAVREVVDYEANLESLEEARPQEQSAAYVKHQDFFDSKHSERNPAEYDMEEADLHWLTQFNEKVAKATRQKGICVLSAADFEHIMEKLEVLHMQLLKGQPELWQAEVKACRAPSIPPPQSILSKAAAKCNMKDQEPFIVEAVYEYWVQKRSQHSGPLLAKLWFEQPWKAVSYFPKDSDDEDESDHNAPFMVNETKNDARLRLRMTDAEAVRILRAVRNELELVRTLADQVRRREKVKKQLVLVWGDLMKDQDTIYTEGSAVPSQELEVEKAADTTQKELGLSAADLLPLSNGVSTVPKKKLGRPPKVPKKQALPKPKEPCHQAPEEKGTIIEPGVVASLKRERSSKVADLRDPSRPMPRTSKRLRSDQESVSMFSDEHLADGACIQPTEPVNLSLDAAPELCKIGDTDAVASCPVATSTCQSALARPLEVRGKAVLGRNGLRGSKTTGGPSGEQVHVLVPQELLTCNLEKGVGKNNVVANGSKASVGHPASCSEALHSQTDVLEGRANASCPERVPVKQFQRKSKQSLSGGLEPSVPLSQVRKDQTTQAGVKPDATCGSVDLTVPSGASALAENPSKNSHKLRSGVTSTLAAAVDSCAVTTRRGCTTVSTACRRLYDSNAAKGTASTSLDEGVALEHNPLVHTSQSGRNGTSGARYVCPSTRNGVRKVSHSSKTTAAEQSSSPPRDAKTFPAKQSSRKTPNVATTPVVLAVKRKSTLRSAGKERLRSLRSAK